jgi:hypothetical protein
MNSWEDLGNSRPLKMIIPDWLFIFRKIFKCTRPSTSFLGKVLIVIARKLNLLMLYGAICPLAGIKQPVFQIPLTLADYWEVIVFY